MLTDFTMLMYLVLVEQICYAAVSGIIAAAAATAEQVERYCQYVHRHTSVCI